MEKSQEKKQFQIVKLEERIAPSACNGGIHSLGLDGNGGGLLNAFSTADPNANLFSAFLRQSAACGAHG